MSFESKSTRVRPLRAPGSESAAEQKVRRDAVPATAALSDGAAFHGQGERPGPR